MSSFYIALQSVELDRLAVYLDSNIIPWHINKTWEDLLPSEWFQVRMPEGIGRRVMGLRRLIIFFFDFFKVLFFFNIYHVFKE